MNGEAQTSLRPPIVVDLDGTLLRTDTLAESAFALAGRTPSHLLLMPFWLIQGGRAGLKRQIAERVALDVERLPRDERLVSWLRHEREMGRRLHLYSAADQSIVSAVASSMALFDSARGSDGLINLSGRAKLEAIRAALGERFVYAGDSRKDLPIWDACGAAVLAGPASLRKALPGTVRIEAAFPRARGDLRTWRRALRLHQWAKNGLVFIAPVLGGAFVTGLAHALVGFVVFGLIASATYLVNDMLDLGHDRLHPRKRLRPLASGAIGLLDGLKAVALMGIAAGLLMLALPGSFAIVAGVYLVVTLAYSLHVKRRLMLDVFTLAGLFTIRVAAGIAVVQHPVSPWLIAFSMFFFLSLACMKRYGECLLMTREGIGILAGRAYVPSDAPWLMAVGAGSAFSAMSTFFLFLVSPGSPVLSYPHPYWMWPICIILGYWICRSWALASRGLMNDDPVLFALRDRLSLVLAGATVALMVLARG